MNGYTDTKELQLDNRQQMEDTVLEIANDIEGGATTLLALIETEHHGTDVTNAMPLLMENMFQASKMLRRVADAL